MSEIKRGTAVSGQYHIRNANTGAMDVKVTSGKSISYTVKSNPKPPSVHVKTKGPTSSRG
jgi:hypothetical protein